MHFSLKRLIFIVVNGLVTPLPLKIQLDIFELRIGIVAQ